MDCRACVIYIFFLQYICRTLIDIRAPYHNIPALNIARHKRFLLDSESMGLSRPADLPTLFSLSPDHELSGSAVIPESRVKELNYQLSWLTAAAREAGIQTPWLER
jgi:hypothetical protein